MAVEKSQTQGRPLQFVSWLLAERLVRGLVTAVVLAAVARHLQPQGFGLLNLALAVVGTIMPLSQLGLEAVLVRELIRRPEDTGRLLGTSAVLRLMIGSGCGAGLLLAVTLVPTTEMPVSVLGPVCLLLFFQAFEVVDCWFRSRVQARNVVMVRSVALLVGAGLKLILVFAGAGVAAFAWVYGVEAALFAGALLWSWQRHRPDSALWRWCGATAGRLLRECWGFALAATIGGVAFRYDQFAVAAQLGGDAAGLYYGALRIVELPTFVATATATALLPMLATDLSKQDMVARLETVFGIMSALAWPTAIGLTAAGYWLVPLFLGSAYAPAWPVLAVQGWAALFYFTGLIRAHYLTVSHAPGTQLVAALIALVVQIGLTGWLVPRWGITGAATAFLGMQMAGALILPLLLPALRPCLKPQLRGWLAPWQPRRWRGMLSVIHG